MKTKDRKRLAILLTFVAPLSLAILELFHPIPHDLFHVDLQRWMLVHYLQIVLFPLCALAVIVLARGLTGFAIVLCRVTMFIFAVTYVAFEHSGGCGDWSAHACSTGIWIAGQLAPAYIDNMEAPHHRGRRVTP